MLFFSFCDFIVYFIFTDKQYEGKLLTWLSNLLPLSGLGT
ncbi:unnamed protein product, partial [Tenebrio molitor]